MDPDINLGPLLHFLGCQNKTSKGGRKFNDVKTSCPKVLIRTGKEAKRLNFDVFKCGGAHTQNQIMCQAGQLLNPFAKIFEVIALCSHTS